jgi:hypothetical protein
MSETPLSTETLRAELNGLELRLVDRLTRALELKADVGVVATLSDRITSLELTRASREHLVPDLSGLQQRVAVVEDKALSADAVSNYRRWLFGGVAVGTLGLLLAVADFIVHHIH